MSNEIAVIETNAIALAYQQPMDGLELLYQSLATQVKSVVPDVTTDKGRKAIISLAAKVSKAKVAVDDHGKQLLEEKKKEIKLTDDARKSWRDKMDALRDETRQPVTDWENAEEARLSGHQSNIAWINGIGLSVFESSAKYQEAIDALSAHVIDDSYQEFKAEAIVARDASLISLRAKHTAIVQREDEQAELERLRAEDAKREQAEREKRIADQAAAKARADAELKAKADLEKAEKEKHDAQCEQARLAAEAEASKLREDAAKRQAELDREQAEKDKIAAIARAEADKQEAIEAEKKRAADAIEAKRIADEKAEKARLANVEHVRSINVAILAKLTELGLDAGMAKKVVTAIARGQVPFTSIQY